MYRHGDGIRRRRVGQPPLPPQHLMGIAQQGPGVIMPMPNQPVQILQQNQHHYSTQTSYSAGQQSNTPYVAPAPPQSAAYHQQPPFTHANTQVVLTKQAVNHSKHYREEYKVVKDQNFSGDQSQINYNYRQPAYNGQHPAPPISQPQSESNMAHPTSVTTEKDDSSQDEDAPSPDSTTKDPIPSGSMFGVKEKTPMCLVNELARFNKIIPLYRLTNEQGPAHKKSFTVKLSLGNEEYSAEGPSIKKAQHAAAATALNNTSYKHPPPKHNKHPHMGKTNMTPTVELNALAMKRGEMATYKLIDPHVPVCQSYMTYTFRRPYGRGGRMPVRHQQNYAYTVSLKIGDFGEFFGEGCSPQAARHDAAAKALSQLRLLPMPETAASTSPAQGGEIELDLESSIKSPISLVHETALKRNLNVVFTVVSEKGPPHMKTFITECAVGEFKSEGEGNGKKISKKRAAENMLQELKKLPPLSPSLACSITLSRLKRKPPQAKKKSRNLIKVTQEPKAETETPEEMNPISRLIQIQQVKKEREPVYTLLEEKGQRRKRDFVMKVEIGQLTATGSGPNKKVAKKYAAQNLLLLIEGAAPTLDGGSTGNTSNDVKVDAKQSVPSGSSGRQLAPGLLLVSEQQSFSISPPESEKPTGNVAQASHTGQTAVKPALAGFGAKDQLLYLGKLLNFDVSFSDYPKANHSEHLTLVSLSTDPPQVCHGSAATVEESHNQAAATALRALAEMGLDSVTTSQKECKLSPSGKTN